MAVAKGKSTVVPSTMNGKEYKAAIRKLGLSQAGAAKFFGYTSRQSRRICSGNADIKLSTEKLIRVMLHLALTVPMVNEMVGKKRKAVPPKKPAAAEATA